MERLQRSAGVAELAVVVVLDDGRAAAGGPVQQLEAAVAGHDYAERVLV
jgi:hypothetical protein